jgi:iron complex transport system permease protein
MSRKFLIRGITLISLVFVFSFFDIIFGSTAIPLKDVFKLIFDSDKIQPQTFTILTQFRLPKMFTSVLAGAALSVAGLQMQTLFRNPLAGPDVLGISAGAGLGVALLVLGFSSFVPGFSNLVAGNWEMAFSAWLGASAVLVLLFFVSFRVKDVTTILILGILFGSAVGAFINLMQYFGNIQNLKSYILWTMGSVGGVTVTQLYVLIPITTVGIFMAFLSSKSLNVLLMGENYAKSMGLNLRNARLFIFLSTGLLTGGVTAFCGPIGFIGIIVPHLAAMVFKTADHKILIPASAGIGAVLLLFSDIITQIPSKSGSLPLNSVTALFGIPILIVIVLRARI